LIVVQKPLKLSEIAPLLEASVQQLVNLELCIEVEDECGEKSSVVNQRGIQLFSRK